VVTVCVLVRAGPLGATTGGAERTPRTKSTSTEIVLLEIARERDGEERRITRHAVPCSFRKNSRFDLELPRGVLVTPSTTVRVRQP
jgi:hypothetical protein